MEKREHFGYVDLIEALAILLVVMYHSTTYDFSFFSDGSAIWRFRAFLRGFEAICVPLFFFANGYLLLNHDFDLKKHIVKSIRLVFITFVWGAIDMLALIQIRDASYSPIEFIECLWTWPADWINHFWYMGALICIYVFFPLIKNVYDNNRQIFIYFTVIVAVMTFGNSFINYFGTYVLSFVREPENVLYLNWFGMFNPFREIHGYAIVYFCIGGLIHNYVGKIRNINIWRRIALSTIVIIVCCCITYYQGVVFTRINGAPWDVICLGYDTIPTFLMVLAVFNLALFYKGNVRNIKIISANTLGIYCIHMILIVLTKPYAYSVPFLCTYIGGIVYALCIVICSLIISILIKKIPIIKYIL